MSQDKKSGFGVGVEALNLIGENLDTGSDPFYNVSFESTKKYKKPENLL